MKINVIGSEVGMSGQAYQGKPWAQSRAVALAGTPMTSCTTSRSFPGGNDHEIPWPAGTGGLPSG